MPARAAGIETSLRLADAKATLPNILSEEIDRAGDLKALTALAGWLVRFSPLVAFDGEDGLVLETTGCDHLFGGEAAMAAQLSRHLAWVGYTHGCQSARKIDPLSASKIDPTCAVVAGPGRCNFSNEWNRPGSAGGRILRRGS